MAKIESVALSETYSSVTRLKVSKVRSEGWAARLKTTELPVGINPGTLGDTVTSGSRLTLPQSNLDRSTMHKWSNDPRAVHKLVTYSVTMLSGTLGVIPLRIACALSLSPFPFLFLVLFSPLFRLAKRKMYRAVTFPPLNPSKWAVPPWRTYRTNFAPVHDAARSLKGMKAVSIYMQSVANSRCSFRDLFIALHGWILFDYSLWTASRASSLTVVGRGNTEVTVTNYLNDRLRASDLRLISEALFDGRTKTRSGWDTLVLRWVGLKELHLR